MNRKVSIKDEWKKKHSIAIYSSSVVVSVILHPTSFCSWCAVRPSTVQFLWLLIKHFFRFQHIFLLCDTSKLLCDFLNKDLHNMEYYSLSVSKDDYYWFSVTPKKWLSFIWCSVCVPYQAAWNSLLTLIDVEPRCAVLLHIAADAVITLHPSPDKFCCFRTSCRTPVRRTICRFMRWLVQVFFCPWPWEPNGPKSSPMCFRMKSPTFVGFVTAIFWQRC